MHARACLQFIKGDWAEFSSHFGFNGWGSLTRPCLFCECDRADLYQYGDVSFADNPWSSCTHTEWNASCVSAEVPVAVTHADWQNIKTLLFADKRTHGNKGRCLSRDYAPLNLRKGDRLEQQSNFPDVYGEPQVFPARLMFWRKPNEVGTRFRCSLFNEVIPKDRVQIDIMHTVYLGTAQDWLGAVCWNIIMTNFYNVPRQLTEAEAVEMTMTRLRAELGLWTDGIKKSGNAPSYFTPLDDFFDWKAIGTVNKPAFGAKAAQTKSVLPCFQKLLVDNPDKLNERGRLLQAAGSGLLEVIRILKSAGNVPTPDECQVSECGIVHVSVFFFSSEWSFPVYFSEW